MKTQDRPLTVEQLAVENHFQKGKINVIEAVEGCPTSKSSDIALLLLPLTLCSVESVVITSLMWSVGAPLAIASGMFPSLVVVLLAYLSAVKKDLPSRLSTVKEEYVNLINEPVLSREEANISGVTPVIPLIECEVEYKERRIDERIRHVSDNDPSSLDRSFGMVDATFDESYFRSRIEELERNRDYIVHSIIASLNEEVSLEDDKPTPGPKHSDETRRTARLQTLTSEREEKAMKRSQLEAGRFSTVILQAQERVARASQRKDVLLDNL